MAIAKRKSPPAPKTGLVIEGRPWPGGYKVEEAGDRIHVRSKYKRADIEKAIDKVVGGGWQRMKFEYYRENGTLLTGRLRPLQIEWQSDGYWAILEVLPALLPPSVPRGR